MKYQIRVPAPSNLRRQFLATASEVRPEADHVELAGWMEFFAAKWVGLTDDIVIEFDDKEGTAVIVPGRKQEKVVEAKAKTALERGVEMMSIKQNKLPPLALAFANKLCREFGGCGEVFITAFAVYAKAVEGLENDDPAYEPRPSDIEWLNSQLFPA